MALAGIECRPYCILAKGAARFSERNWQSRMKSETVDKEKLQKT